MNEQNELLEAALRLAEIAGFMSVPLMDDEEACQLIATIEKHRPKPKPIERFLVLSHRGHDVCYSRSKGDAMASMQTGDQIITLREATDPPKWDKWVACLGPVNIEIGDRRVSHCDIQAIADAHNAEMARLVAAWKGEE
jgi:hypothetical protein